MVEVEMTKDIHDYDPKLFGLITLRQLVLLLIGLAYSVPITLLLPIEDLSVKVMVLAVLMTPAIMCGWVTVYGLKLEQYVKQVVISTFLSPQNRLYKIEGSVDFLQEEEQKTSGKKRIKPSTKYKPYK